MTEWFTQWFGKEYLDLYPHRDEAEACAAIDMIVRSLCDGSWGAALDLACGSGRHTRALCEHGWTVGLDLSPTLIHLAASESPDIPYVRGDMRVLPFRSAAFDLVVNLFTSFGYVETDQENYTVLAEVHRVLRRDGHFVLDYLNADRVRVDLVPVDTQEIDGKVITQRRDITADGRYVTKHITVSGSDTQYMERVRLFEPAELRDMLGRAGFRIERELGDYSGAPLTVDAPRAVFIATRE
jgi:SAM-dependent methyltransferase